MSLLRRLFARRRPAVATPARTPNLLDVAPDALAVTRAHAHLGTARRHLGDADRAATQWIATDSPETAAVYTVALLHQLTEAQAAVRAALDALQQGGDR